jgi:hypothetical protein
VENYKVEESREDWKLIYEQGAKNLLTYLFLKNFHEKFTKLLDTISLYLSQYEMFETYYITNNQLQMIREIKVNLLSTIYILNSMNLEPALRLRVQKIIEKLDEIINKVVLSKNDLQFLLENLSFILANSFLKDISKTVPSATKRIVGDVE